MEPHAQLEEAPAPCAAYPQASEAQAARFRAEGFLVVPDAIPCSDLALLRSHARTLVGSPPPTAKDWDWRAGEGREVRDFRIVSCGIYGQFPELQSLALHGWMQSFAQLLMGRGLQAWYHQFLGKPPGIGAPTPWHQDEAYWGRNLRDRGITCWAPLHDVDPANGCMHFIPGVHRLPVREHANPASHASDLLVTSELPGDAVVACPMRAGSVTFHHSNTPHMTPGNRSGAWRLCIAHHFAATGHCAEGGAYPWRVYVDPVTGKRTPATN
jgi:phytanoyl-CoA hydroxylase